MDNVDKALEMAELDVRSPSHSQPQVTQDSGERQDDEKLGRLSTASSGSSSSSSNVTDQRRMSRINTLSDEHCGQAKHPTTLSRIETARSQHSGTVGAGLKSRKSKKPLPNFGAGKPYPPLLPEKEEYVVEFDGPDVSPPE